MGSGRGSHAFKIRMHLEYEDMSTKVTIEIKKPDRVEYGVLNKRNKFLRSIAIPSIAS